MPLMSVPSWLMLPRLGATSPEIARSTVDFPAPLVPSSAIVSPSAQLEAHAEQHLHLAVRDVDRPQAEEVGLAAAQCEVGVGEVVDVGHRTRAGSACRNFGPRSLGRVAVRRHRDRGLGLAPVSSSGSSPMSAMSDGTTRLRRRGDPAQPRVARLVEQRPEATGQQPQHDDEPDAAARERGRGTGSCWGTTPLNHSVLLRKIAPRIAPGTDPSPPTTTIVSARMLSTGAKIVLAERLLVEREHAAGERREEARQREGEQLGACRAEAERLRVALVLARWRRGRARSASAGARAP